mmetsp:Transcript_11232/g.15136  ORF Transcript_11232/g.15136 Transcript_11232/m.15136 type:complete len:209 (-) Transcript_11232:1190-1816(-)
MSLLSATWRCLIVYNLDYLSDSDFCFAFLRKCPLLGWSLGCRLLKITPHGHYVVTLRADYANSAIGHFRHLSLGFLIVQDSFNIYLLEDVWPHAFLSLTTLEYFLILRKTCLDFVHHHFFFLAHHYVRAAIRCYWARLRLFDPLYFFLALSLMLLAVNLDVPVAHLELLFHLSIRHDESAFDSAAHVEVFLAAIEIARDATPLLLLAN